MQKTILVLICSVFLTLSLAFAQKNKSKFINVQKLLSNDYSQDIDIGYTSFIPQFEEKQKAENNVAVEIFYGEIDDSKESQQRLDWLKYQLQQDLKTSNKFRSEITAYGPSGSNLKRDTKANKFIKYIKLSDTKVKFDSIPENLKISSGYVKTTYNPNKTSDRKPAGLSGRTFWTLVRMSTITSGTSVSIYYSSDVDPGVAFTVGLASGLGSASVTYYSAAYGKFLTSGAWSKWLIESDTKFAIGLRKSFGIDNKSISQLLTKQEKVLIKRHPELAKTPELFDKALIEQVRKKFTQDAVFRKRLVKLLGNAEEYLKWWITEIAFTVFALKIPQSLAGIGVAASASQVVSQTLVAGTMGLLSQGPVDIALQIRKYQMIEELREQVKTTRAAISGKEALLAEIEKVLAKEGPNASYVINDNSHFALRKIENLARARATFLSFISVMGVGMKVANIPLSDPILITLGTGGAFYYAKVQGVFSKSSKIGRGTTKFIDKFHKGMSRLRPFYIRYCLNFFKAYN